MREGHSNLILLTGATGYVGGRLGPRLLEAGYRLRCLVRSKRKLQGRTWAQDPRVEICESDALDVAQLTGLMRGCDAAYYLIHSMQAVGRAYAESDIRLAKAFSEAAGRARVNRIVYLGGLGEVGENLSEHLTSRREVERALSSGDVTVTVFRAAMIIGSGSASFEILRYLVERLPVMITPRWVSTQSQPIAIRNVLHYLVACLSTPQTIGQTLDIGGIDTLTYRQLMKLMVRALGVRRRWIVPVPVLTPRLSSMWIHLVTPVGYRLARPLAEGLRNRVVCRDRRAVEWMPQRLLSVSEAIDAALGKIANEAVETAWSDAGVIPGDPAWAGGTEFTDSRTTQVYAESNVVFRAICKVGGGHGYYAADGLWRLRGVLDKIVGGPGLRRGRRHPHHLYYGDALDFWRVTEVQEPCHLLLQAEMKLPGMATLEFRVDPVAYGGQEPQRLTSRITQIARFRPRGLTGLLYWYAVLPLHHIVFNGMLRGIRAEAHAIAR